MSALVEPQGCGRCGVPERGHAQRWKKPLSGDGWHTWERPSDAQVLERMHARRLARAVAKHGAFPMPAGSDPKPVSDERLAGTFDQFEEPEQRRARWEAAAHAAGREVDRNALRAYMAVADAEQRKLADDWAKSVASGDRQIERLRARVAELEAGRKADHETWQHDLRTARSEREAAAVRIAELESSVPGSKLAQMTAAERAVARGRTAEAGRIVAYRVGDSGSLYCCVLCCRGSGRLVSLTSEDLPDGGVCTACGTDVLIPRKAGGQ